jgi:hypothetical protein
VVPPPWAPNAYFRLSFTQHHHHKHLQHGEPMVSMHSACTWSLNAEQSTAATSTICSPADEPRWATHVVMVCAGCGRRRAHA